MWLWKKECQVQVLGQPPQYHTQNYTKLLLFGPHNFEQISSVVKLLLWKVQELCQITKFHAVEVHLRTL